MIISWLYYYRLSNQKPDKATENEFSMNNTDTYYGAHPITPKKGEQ